MTSSNCTVYFQSIAVLVAVLTIVTDVTASQPQVYKVFQTDVKLSTGACPWMYLDTEAACAIQCYMNTWCRVYVIGPCHLSAPNSCVCTICHMNPEVIENQAGRSSRKIQYPKRLVDQNNCGGGHSWSNVAQSCREPSYSIQSSFGASPIMALRLLSISHASDHARVVAAPVCPPYFIARGEVTCSTNEGLWHNQHSLACFPLYCYQTKGGKLYYAGKKNVTMSGKPCWPWRLQGPMDNNYVDKPFMFDRYSVTMAENYCRSFHYNEYPNIWCYNANYPNGGDRYEDCDIAPCELIR